MAAEHVPGTPLILVAPDSFKGTFPATEVADAMAEGIRRAGLQADSCPVADGGEGTTDAILGACGGRYVSQLVSGPLGDRVMARFGLLNDDHTAVVDVASASGWALVPRVQRDPERASSAGTGELILAAARAGATTILVAAGGSATTDGGMGAIAAIEQAGGLGNASLVVLCDVQTPFEDAARVFGPQKGADPAAVRRLTDRLAQIASSLPRDPRNIKWGGCAGGLSGGLWAAFGATLAPGASTVLDALEFDRRLAQASTVITGEGRIDGQSFTGKVTGEIAARSRRAGRQVHAIVGRSGLGPAGHPHLASVSKATTIPEIQAAAGRLAHQWRDHV